LGTMIIARRYAMPFDFFLKLARGVTDKKKKYDLHVFIIFWRRMISRPEGCFFVHKKHRNKKESIMKGSVIFLSILGVILPICLFLPGQGCPWSTTQELVIINNPKANTTYTECQGPALEVTFPNGKPTYVSMILNGMEVGRYFEYNEDGSAGKLDAEGACPYLVQGKNYILITANQPNLVDTATVNFYYDTLAPWLRFDNIEEIGDSLLITGKVVESSKIQSFLINGVAATLKASSKYSEYHFTAEIDNAETLRFFLEDEYQHAREFSVLRPGRDIEEAARFYMNNEALNVMMGEVNELLYSISSVCQYIPQFSTSFSYLDPTTGQKKDNTFSLKGVNCGEIAINLNPVESETRDFMKLTSVINNVEIKIELCQAIDGGEPQCQEYGMSIGKLTSMDTTQLAIIENVISVLAHGIDVVMEEVNFDGFDEIFKSICQNIENIPIPGMPEMPENCDLNQLIEVKVAENTKTFVEQFYASLRYEGDINGLYPFFLSMLPKGLTIDPNWTDAMVHGSIYPLERDEDVEVFPGSYLLDAFSPVKSGQCNDGCPYDMIEAVNGNIINQSYYSNFSSGMYHDLTYEYKINSAYAYILEPLLNVLEEVMQEEFGDVWMIDSFIFNFHHLTPPSVAMEGDNLIRFKAPDLLLQVNGQDTDDNIHELFTLLIHIEQLASLNVDGNGHLLIALTGAPQIDMILLPTSAINIPMEPIEQVINKLMGDMMTELIQSMADWALPEEYQQVPLRISQIKTDGQYLSLYFGN
jgi:hypothetical protein